MVMIERGQHTRNSRTRGLAQAERLLDGYRCSFLLSSSLIHCCYRNACTQSIAVIGARCRRGLNLQGSEVAQLARDTPRRLRDAYRQTDRQTDRSAFTKIETQFGKLRIPGTRFVSYLRVLFPREATANICFLTCYLSSIGVS